MTLTITRLAPHVSLPAYGTPGAAAFDLAASTDTVVPPHGIALVPTGLVVRVPEGHFLAILARSSTPLTRGLIVANGMGVVDSDYCGPTDEVKIQVLNISNGYRLETYVIPGGPGDLIVNGAAARHAVKGDRLIVIAYGLLTDDEIRTHVPKVLVLNEKNQIVDEH